MASQHLKLTSDKLDLALNRLLDLQSTLHAVHGFPNTCKSPSRRFREMANQPVQQGADPRCSEEWRRWSSPAPLVHMAISEIVAASKSAKEAVDMVTDCNEKATKGRRQILSQNQCNEESVLRNSNRQSLPRTMIRGTQQIGDKPTRGAKNKENRTIHESRFELKNANRPLTTGRERSSKTPAMVVGKCKVVISGKEPDNGRFDDATASSCRKEEIEDANCNAFKLQNPSPRIATSTFSLLQSEEALRRRHSQPPAACFEEKDDRIDHRHSQPYVDRIDHRHSQPYVDSSCAIQRSKLEVNESISHVAKLPKASLKFTQSKIVVLQPEAIPDNRPNSSYLAECKKDVALDRRHSQPPSVLSCSLQPRKHVSFETPRQNQPPLPANSSSSRKLDLDRLDFDACKLPKSSPRVDQFKARLQSEGSGVSDRRHSLSSAETKLPTPRCVADPAAAMPSTTNFRVQVQEIKSVRKPWNFSQSKSSGKNAVVMFPNPAFDQSITPDLAQKACSKASPRTHQRIPDISSKLIPAAKRDKIVRLSPCSNISSRSNSNSARPNSTRIISPKKNASKFKPRASSISPNRRAASPKKQNSWLRRLSLMHPSSPTVIRRLHPQPPADHHQLSSSTQLNAPRLLRIACTNYRPASASKANNTHKLSTGLKREIDAKKEGGAEVGIGSAGAWRVDTDGM